MSDQLKRAVEFFAKLASDYCGQLQKEGHLVASALITNAAQANLNEIQNAIKQFEEGTECK